MVEMVLLTFLIGICVGSFLNVCIFRIPKEENIAFPPSHCTTCNYRLKWYDNIPVLSYFILKGKCRSCGEKFSMIYPLTEFFTGLLFAAIFLKFEFSWETIIYSVYVSILIVILFIDLREYIIPDSLVVGIFLLGLIKLFLIKDISYKNGLISSVVVFAIFYLLFIGFKDKFGGGDVKLFAALALFQGWPIINLEILMSSFLGLLVGGFMILSGKMQKSQPIPFGPFIVAAAVALVFIGEDLWTWYEIAIEGILF